MTRGAGTSLPPPASVCFGNPLKFPPPTPPPSLPHPLGLPNATADRFCPPPGWDPGTEPTGDRGANHGGGGGGVRVQSPDVLITPTAGHFRFLLPKTGGRLPRSSQQSCIWGGVFVLPTPLGCCSCWHTGVSGGGGGTVRRQNLPAACRCRTTPPAGSRHPDAPAPEAERSPVPVVFGGGGHTRTMAGVCVCVSPVCREKKIKQTWIHSHRTKRRGRVSPHPARSRNFPGFPNTDMTNQKEPFDLFLFPKNKQKN